MSASVQEEQGAALRDRANRSKKSAGWSGAPTATVCDLNSNGAGARLLAAAVAIVAALALLASSASAAETRVVESIVGSGELSLAANSGVAVNETTHDVYVSDTGDGEIAEFKSDGTPLGTFGTLTAPTFIAVDNSAEPSKGSVYVVDSSGTRVSKFTAGGTPESAWGTAGSLEGFGLIAGIAVSEGGVLYVLEENSAVHSYSSAGIETSLFQAPRGTSVAGLAVDSANDLYKVDGSPEVTKFDTTGETLTESLTGRSDAVGLGVDPATDELLVLNGNEGSPFVNSFAVGCGGPEESCSPKGTFGEGELTQASGVTIDGTSNHVYVADPGAGQVDVFGSPVIVPDVTAEEPGETKANQAILRGEVNPLGIPITECKFEYTAEGSAASSTPCSGPIPTDGQAHQVEAAVSDLSPNTNYTVRVVARNANGFSKSKLVPFTTKRIATTEPATEITGTSVQLNGSILPEGSIITECVFEYGESEAYGNEVPCAGAIPADEAAHQVSAAVAGLTTGGVLYHYRVLVHEGATAIVGADQTFETKGATVIEESTRAVGLAEALVQAEVNPHGPEATYFVEWGPTDTYGQRTDEGSLEAGEQPVAVQQVIDGLQPGTTYHFRFAVVDEFGETKGADATFTTFSAGSHQACPNEVFRTLSGSWLPNCRAFEQVTPTEKAGGQAEGLSDLLQAAPDGESMTLASQAGLPGGQGAQEFPSFIATKKGESWSLKGLLPPTSIGEEAIYLGMSTDTKEIITEAGEPGLGYGVFAQNLETGAISTVVPYRPHCAEGRGCVVLVGGNVDGSVLILESHAQLTAEPITGETQVYAWHRSTGELSLVGVNEMNEPLSEGAIAGPYNWYNGITEAGGAFEHLYDSAVNGVTPNGEVAFYTAASGDQLYMRTGIASGTPKTARVSASQRTVGAPESDRPAIFLAAAEDGSRVLFMSRQKLTNDATTGEFDEGRDLYSYNVESGHLTDLVPDLADEDGAEVQGILGASSDARSVYFVALGHLAEGGVAGQNNLYHYYESEGQSHIVFVTQLAEGGFGGYGFNDSSDWSPLSREQGSNEPAPRTARVSATGNAVVYTSVIAPTGFDNRSPGCLTSGSELQPCREVFVYSAETEKVDCISCNSNGTDVFGSAELQASFINAYTGGSGTLPARLSHNVSADGSKVFFDTPDSLGSRDVNGRNGCSFAGGKYGSSCQDVYEWEAAGTPQCPIAESSGGCLSILSTGEESRPSFFGEADPTGKDVFIFTGSQLVPADRDQLYDVYDARENGGLPSQYATPVVPCGSRPACEGSSISPSASTTPSTSTFSGPGNPKTKPGKQCAKGKKKCQKKKQHKKKQHKKKQHKKKHRNGANGSRSEHGNKTDKGGHK